MNSRLGAIFSLSALLAACANTPKPAICDGDHRRPANLYGSVLTPESEPPGAPGSASPAKPPKKTSALVTRTGSCTR